MEPHENVLPTFPFERPRMGPPAEYASMREAGKLQKVKLWDGKIAWLATRYEDVRALLADNRFSADPRRAGFPHVTPARNREKQEQLPFFVMLDPPEHTRYRRSLTKEFTVNRVQALRSMIEKTVDELLDQLLAKHKPVDLIAEFCLVLPTTVIVALLGIPYEDHAFFQHRTNLIINADAAPGEGLKAGNEMRAYMLEIVQGKAKNPEAHDDILGRLIVDHVRTGNLSLEEAAMLGVFLLIAGHETTGNMLGLGVLSLLQNPDVFKLLATDPPPMLIRKTVEEMLRYHSIVHFTGTRVALVDVDYNGVSIKAGEGILPQILGANHDPEKFERPGEFNVARTGTSPHVAFGFGIHQCIGQPLARLELDVVFEILPKRLPGLRLAVPFEDLSFKRMLLVHGLHKLPVTW